MQIIRLIAISYLIISSPIGYISMKLDQAGNIVFSKRWTTFPSTINYYGNGLLQLMKYHNNYLYCPIKYANNVGLFVFDTLMTGCGITDTVIILPELAYSPPLYKWYQCTSISYSLAASVISAAGALNPTSINLCNIINLLDEITDSDIVVSPNPFQNKVALSFLHEGRNSICIFSVNGEKLFEKEFFSNNEIIDLHFLANGIYFLCIKTKEHTLTKKLVKLN